MKIQNAQHAATVIESLRPEKMELLVKGLRAQHPHLRASTDEEVRAILREFISRAHSEISS